MVRVVAALATVIIAVSGCARLVAGSAVPNDEAAKDASSPLTARQALGEFTTINYCSLLDSKPLPADLGSITGQLKPAYEFCSFGVRVNGTEVDVRVGYLDDSDTISEVSRTDDRSKTPPRGLTIQRGREGDDGCERFLRFTDDIWLTVAARPESGKGDWCRVADATIDSVIGRVIAKQVKHFSFPDKSVGKLDACELVPAAVVNAKLGIKDSEMLRFPAGHACYWRGHAASDPIARLYLGAGDSTSGDDTKEETLAGHRSYVTPYVPDEGDASVCDVETDHIDSPDLGEKELVVVEVDLEGKGKDACGPARELAKEVWATLPKP